MEIFIPILYVLQKLSLIIIDNYNTDIFIENIIWKQLWLFFSEMISIFVSLFVRI